MTKEPFELLHEDLIQYKFSENVDNIEPSKEKYLVALVLLNKYLPFKDKIN